MPIRDRSCRVACVTISPLPYAGSVTSVHSQPCDRRALLLQVPDVSPVHPRSPLSLTLPRIPPPAPSPSPRSLRRQVRAPPPLRTPDPPTPSLRRSTEYDQLSSSAFILRSHQGALKVDSVECEQQQQQERPSPAHLPPPSPARPSSPSPLPPHPSPLRFPPPPAASPPSSASPLPPPPPSPSLLLPPPPSPRLPLRPASLRRAPRPSSAALLCDPADEEVRSITASAERRRRREEAGGAGEWSGRSHSLSPYGSLDPPSQPVASSSFSSLPPPLSPRSSLALPGGAGLPDGALRRGPSASGQGSPSSLCASHADDHRRHSIEVCLPQPAAAQRSERAGGHHGFPVRVQSVGGGHRKKKMSPPCISIHPPCERERPRASSPPELADTLLRRRTPSYDLLTPADLPVVLAPSPKHALAPPPASSPVRLHTTVGPDAFAQPPRASLLPNAVAFPPSHALAPSPGRSPPTGECGLRPQFTFDQPQSRYVTDNADGTCSSPFENRLGGGTGFSGKNRRTAQ